MPIPGLRWSRFAAEGQEQAHDGHEGRQVFNIETYGCQSFAKFLRVLCKRPTGTLDPIHLLFMKLMSRMIPHKKKSAPSKSIKQTLVSNAHVRFKNQTHRTFASDLGKRRAVRNVLARVACKVTIVFPIAPVGGTSSCQAGASCSKSRR